MKITPTISTEPDTWSVIRDYARDNSDHNTSQWARRWLLAAVLYEQRHDGPPSWIDAETIGGLDIDDDAFLHALGGVRANTDDFDAPVRIGLADNGDDLGRPDIQAYDHSFVFYISHVGVVSSLAYSFSTAASCGVS